MSCAFDNGKTCIALRNKICNKCNFYMTPEQLEASRQAAIRRLKRLGIYETMKQTYVLLEVIG
jgi:ribosomal protein L16/L10AE